MIRRFTVVLALVLASGAQAQINHPINEVGLFTVEDPVGCETAQVAAPSGTVFTCYMVLTNPWNETLDRPVANVGGYEFRLGVPDGVYLLTATVPPCPTCFQSPPDFIFAIDKPVIDGRCTLVTFGFMAATDEPRFLSLGPVGDAPQSIPGQMAFWDLDDETPGGVIAMEPVSGSPDVPVFAINWDGALSFCETVPDEGMAFGAVKALYR